MSWKCEICDSYNEDTVTTCFVCGQVRSETSIREEKERIRAEKERARAEKARIKETGKAEKVPIRGAEHSRHDKLAGALERIGKVLYAGSVGVAAVVILLLLAGRILGSDLDMVFSAAGAVLERCWDNVARTLLVGVNGVLQRVSNGQLQQLPQSAQAILTEAESAMWDLTHAVDALVDTIFG